MIIGLGMDLCSVSRMKGLLGRWGERFVAKIFTDAERSYCDARAFPEQHFAARFAAREAALKALGVPRGLSWHELEVVSAQGRPPLLKLKGEAAAAAARIGAVKTHLTITHVDDLAAAVVILESA